MSEGGLGEGRDGEVGRARVPSSVSVCLVHFVRVSSRLITLPVRTIFLRPASEACWRTRRVPEIVLCETDGVV